MQVRQFRLNRASAEDSLWLCELLNRLGAPLNTRAQLEDDHSLTLQWQ
jgi:poly-gamma-glutamate synthesis protein (capsule biosynthesis protein)